MKVLYERVAGIDVHKDMIKVAIRSPGEEPWTRTTGVFEFRTFYGVLQEVARDLRRRGVAHVVMETGSFAAAGGCGPWRAGVFCGVCLAVRGGRVHARRGCRRS